MVVTFGKNPSGVVNFDVVNKAKKTKWNHQTPNIRITKQGNPYYHSNAGKKAGIGIGVGMTILGTAILGFASKKITKIPLTPIAKGFVLGAIFDGVFNNNEKKKADQMKAFYA